MAVTPAPKAVSPASMEVSSASMLEELPKSVAAGERSHSSVE
eukprot:CAMPEP_0175934462 /NCGR_PEP_ID=MMETSP0108-20121206/20503_1 /TAXON_ID=195067 ORGANISM="Goniomonas pacifica, Strain CCMP1869" /NCGR_SAMPLE_ID=MMETSP0108 /ASSEMBLY_ACC=CAM_ASM_000204 /LENGTH=41 /DNA_ID= /DNA_START= /DNA_END= /DNA_ORIENTATION=